MSSLGLAELVPAAGGAAANGDVAVGFVGPVAAVLWAPVAPDLPADRAAVSPQAAGNLAGIESFLAERGYDYPLRQGELVVRHGFFSFLAGAEKAPVSQVHPPNSGVACCT